MTHTELDLMERQQIEEMLLAKAPIAKIAERLSRHRSTVYREINRNTFADEEMPELDGYYGKVAQKIAGERRHRRRKLALHSDLLAAVLQGFEAGWSPEQIAGRMRVEKTADTVSHETIYAWVYSKDGQRENLARYLPSRRRKRRLRGSRKPRDTVFPQERRIKNRPDEIEGREIFGHWEGDLMIFRRELGPANVTSLVERKTRFAVLFRNGDRRSKPLMTRLIDLLAPLPRPARQSITFDRGFEFIAWQKLKKGMGTEAWFCDPRAPWQKGSVENLNGRARRYLPRELPVAALSSNSMKEVCDKLNGTPRKCLGYRTPSEAFAEEIRKIK